MAVAFSVGGPIRSQTPLLPRLPDPGRLAILCEPLLPVAMQPQRRRGVSEKDRPWRGQKGSREGTGAQGKPCLWRWPVSAGLLPSLPGPSPFLPHSSTPGLSSQLLSLKKKMQFVKVNTRLD